MGVAKRLLFLEVLVLLALGWVWVWACQEALLISSTTLHVPNALVQDGISSSKGHAEGVSVSFAMDRDGLPSKTDHVLRLWSEGDETLDHE